MITNLALLAMDLWWRWRNGDVIGYSRLNRYKIGYVTFNLWGGLKIIFIGRLSRSVPRLDFKNWIL